MSTLSDALDLVGRVRARIAGLRLEADESARLNARRVSAQKGCVLRIGPQSLVPGAITFERANAEIHIGARSFVSGHLIAAERVTVGDDVLMAWGVTVVDHDSHSLLFSQRANDVVDWAQGKKDWTHVAVRPVLIGNKAWIGFNAIILRGITIGEGAVIGAGSVVTRDVAPWTVVAGNPAREIRVLAEHER